MPITAVDHFAGVGWGVACHRLGIIEYGVEIAKSAIRLRAANGMRTIYRDVWSGLRFPWLVPFHDLYIASPPCQTFSIAGNGDGRKALGDVLEAISAGVYRDVEALIALGDRLDPRTALVLAPLAHIWQHRPRLVALEQVPEVLPVWHAYANVMRGLGYSVHVEVMRSEQYGVPQTRKRAILMARLDGKVQQPAPSHSRYYSTDPARLDHGVDKWVSMAEALGFGLESRPSPTITGGGTETGGAEPIAKLARYTESADWAPRGLMSQYGVGGDSEARSERGIDEPASTITSKAGSMKWQGHLVGNQRPPGSDDYHLRSIDAPAQTITSQSHLFKFRQELAEWEWIDAPATTVAGDPRITAREHHEHGEQSGTSLRLTHLEAAALQSFPAEMVWLGNQGERFLAIGNAVPPLLAEAVLGALLTPRAERDEWDNVFAQVAG